MVEVNDYLRNKLGVESFCILGADTVQPCPDVLAHKVCHGHQQVTLSNEIKKEYLPIVFGDAFLSAGGTVELLKEMLEMKDDGEAGTQGPNLFLEDSEDEED